MISIASIICMAVAVLLAIGTPVGLFIFMRKKYKIKAVPMFIGAAAFVLFALVLESIVHALVLRPGPQGEIALMKQPVLYMLYGGFMAGIFEETARFISFKLLKKKYSGVGTGLSYGIGHGGIEAVLIGGLAMISSLAFSLTINSGGITALTGTLEGAALEQISAVATELTTTAAPVFLLGGVERVLALCLQVSLSVIVWQAANQKGKWWLFPCAIAIHAAVDFMPALYQTGVIKNVYLVELYVLVCAAAVAALAVVLHRRAKRREAAETTVQMG